MSCVALIRGIVCVKPFCVPSFKVLFNFCLTALNKVVSFTVFLAVVQAEEEL